MGLDQSAYVVGTDADSGEDFYQRKHARLQVFMNRQWRKQNSEEAEKRDEMEVSLGHLGFNSGDAPVEVTKEVCDELEKAIEENFHNHFASDGFFWGQQFQEESMNEYREQDKKFLKWARERINEGKKVFYDCSWQKGWGRPTRPHFPFEFALR